MDSVFAPRSLSAQSRSYQPVAIADDRMAWYLYLAETYLFSPFKYEYIQGSRVLPVFKRLGASFDVLSRVGGIEEKADRLISVETGHADSGLFEMLVAVLWAKNGWEKVDLLAPNVSTKCPDIRASSGGQEWFIECKRLAQNSGYSKRERAKWLRMWQMFQSVLEENRLPFLLDFVFHVELESLPDEFLRNELTGKIRLVVPPCSLISNKTWDVTIECVDIEAIQRHLINYRVKWPSGQLNELIGGRRDPSRGFTSMFHAKSGRMGSGKGCNVYIESLDFAAGAFWHCDADRSIEQKARDIRGHLADAVQQLPSDARGVVHIGIETLDGPKVEAKRYARIIKTMGLFDPRGKDLRWIYCHLFQPYAPADQAWAYDETVYPFSLCSRGELEPLASYPVVVDCERNWSDGVHWLRDPP